MMPGDLSICRNCVVARISSCPPGLFQRVKESHEITDFIVAETALECGHRAQAFHYRAADLFVCGRRAAGQSFRRKHLLEFWWFRDQVPRRIVMTLRAVQLIQRAAGYFFLRRSARTT